ncbi:YeiH family protein [Mesorhizobium sp. ASY16-5R]|uniref:YeiH family protein n=1 Tax=Mesorhizobium sp. ASY16-5R TaxID=3445772 RepID=UPI003FA0EEC6
MSASGTLSSSAIIEQPADDPFSKDGWRRKAPGVVAAVVVAAAALSLKQVPGFGVFSPVILAVVVGIVFANVVGVSTRTNVGIAFCQRSLLRFAIVLLGFQVTIAQTASVGLTGIAGIALVVLATFGFTLAVGKMLGVERKLIELIAAGTSICGASAIVATNAVTRGRDEDVAYAVASVTLFGTVAMLAYPFLAPVFGLDAHAYGLWAGASIHEVAQVVGAGFQNGQESGEIATVAKLSRVAMLAPVVLALGLLARRTTGNNHGSARPPMPWFVFAFVAVVAFNAVMPLPAEAKTLLGTITTMLLSVGLAAMGLKTDVSDIRSRGLKPLCLALSAFVFIAALSLLLVHLAG